jgi:hypothetical protein
MPVRNLSAEQERQAARGARTLGLVFNVAAWVVWLVGALMTTSVVLPAAEIRPGVAVIGAWPALAGLTLLACAAVQLALSRAQAFILAVLQGRRIGCGVLIAALILFGIDTGINYLALLLPAQIPTEARESLIAYAVELGARARDLGLDGSMVAVVLGAAIGVMPELFWTLAGQFRR